MNRSLLSGAALAAVMVATPALAQQPDDTFCVLNDLSQSRISDDRMSQLDSDGDGRITLVEYQQCLDANVAADQRQQYLTQFTEFDTDRDQVLLIADLQAVGATGQQTADADDGEAAQVLVEEQQANVQVRQPAPTVTVDQAQPRVAVQQPEPQVAVQQQEPEVRVEQRQPEVSVSQPRPQVSVEQPEAQVAIDQAQPQVSMDVPAPEVEVRQAQPQVSVQQVQPQVSVEQPEPEVRVEQAEANVEVQSEEPRVVVEQAEPEVVVERVTSADVETTEAQPRADMETDDATVDVAAVAVDTDVETRTEPMTAGIPFDDIEGEDVYNNLGNDIGEIEDIVMESATGELYVVVSAGGFLGIGDTDIVFPYSAVSMQGDQVVINTNISKDALEERQDYDESLFVEVPEDRVVR